MNTPPAHTETAREEFRDGWGVVLAALLGIGLGMASIPTYTMGLFAPHLAQTFGWSIGAIMSALLIITVMSICMGPVYGALAEKYGTRRIVLIALPLWGASFAALALSDGSLTRFYLTWVAIGLTGAATLPITFTRAVNRRFERAKGLALGCSMLGTGLFGMLGKPFLAGVLAAHGWRVGFVAMGLLPVVIALPAAWLLLREDERALPDGHHIPVPRPGLTTGEALRTWRFWLIAVALIPVSFALGGPVPNLELILRDGGLGPAAVIAVTPLFGLASMTGRLVGGVLLDRVWAPLVTFVILSLPAFSLWYFASGPLDVAHAQIATFTLGFALGIEYDAVAFMVARYFGLRAYSAIYGLLYVCFGAGAGLAPMIFGRDHDANGNFHHILMQCSIVLVVSAASFLLLGRYRRFDGQK